MGIVNLEATARRHAVVAAFRAVGVYAVLIVPFFLKIEGGAVPGFWLPWPWVLGISVVLPLLALLLMPLEKVADKVAKHIKPEPPGLQFENVVTEIGIALNETVESIQVSKSQVANIAMLPCSGHELVVATTGALERLNRHELQALVAAQFAGMRDRWCRLATRAEIMWWGLPSMAAPAIMVGFINGVGILVAMAAIMVGISGPRKNEQERDLCADVAAVRTTMDPHSLASAMRKLAQQAGEADSGKLGAWYLPSNPFLVLPKRIIVGVKGKAREWTSEDEVRMELLLRADRAEALAQGADPRKYTGKEFKRRWSQMGR